MIPHSPVERHGRPSLRSAPSFFFFFFFWRTLFFRSDINTASLWEWVDLRHHLQESGPCPSSYPLATGHDSTGWPRSATRWNTDEKGTARDSPFRWMELEDENSSPRREEERYCSPSYSSTRLELGWTRMKRKLSHSISWPAGLPCCTNSFGVDVCKRQRGAEGRREGGSSEQWRCGTGIHSSAVWIGQDVWTRFGVRSGPYSAMELYQLAPDKGNAAALCITPQYPQVVVLNVSRTRPHHQLLYHECSWLASDQFLVLYNFPLHYVQCVMSKLCKFSVLIHNRYVFLMTAAVAIVLLVALLIVWAFYFWDRAKTKQKIVNATRKTKSNSRLKRLSPYHHNVEAKPQSGDAFAPYQDEHFEPSNSRATSMDVHFTFQEGTKIVGKPFSFLKNNKWKDRGTYKFNWYTILWSCITFLRRWCDI